MNIYPEPYLRYLYLFHCERDFFECHEVMEGYWKSRGQKKDIWLALIQLSVALYHHRRGNFPGAFKMISSSILLAEKADVSETGIDLHALLQRLKERKDEIESRRPYKPAEPFLIPLTDLSLDRRIEEGCHSRKEEPPEELEMKEEILHKHLYVSRKD